MRYVTYVLKPQRDYFDPGEVPMRENGVIPQAIHDLDVLNDGTVVERMSVRGELADVRESFEPGANGVVDYRVAPEGGQLILQLHFHPSPLLRSLLDVHQRHAVLLDYPLEYVGPSNQNLRVSEVGPENELRALIADTREEISIEIEQLGRYDPTTGRLFVELTGRQREVLQTAVEKGYYQVPRKVTYDDIAEHLDCSAGAVGQHLRRIESKIMTEVVAADEPIDDPPSVTPGE